jgi:glycosyltransferase involved in cell wall biosynthesis
MTVTEAAACGTPAVASRIAGHVDAVDDELSGLLFDNDDQLVKALDKVLADEGFRARLSAGAREKSMSFGWDATALGTMEALAAVTKAGRALS